MGEKNRITVILELILGVISILAGVLLINETTKLPAALGDLTVVYLFVAFVVVHGLKRIADNARYLKE